MRLQQRPHFYNLASAFDHTREPIFWIGATSSCKGTVRSLNECLLCYKNTAEVSGAK